MHLEPIIELCDVHIRQQHFQFKQPINWRLNAHEDWVFIGPNGAGKTLLSDVLTGKLPIKSGVRSYPHFQKLGLPIFEAVRSIAFRDIRSIIPDFGQSAYQQRWNSQEAETGALVEEMIVLNPDTHYAAQILDMLGIRELFKKKMIHLSSGEMRKFLIARTLMGKPKVLILDNPFIGLDVESRTHLVQVLKTMSEKKVLQLILLLSNPSDIPDFIEHILPLHQGRIEKPLDRLSFLQSNALLNRLFPLLDEHKKERKFEQFTSEQFSNGTAYANSVVEFKAVHIEYGNNVILKNLYWKIGKGERWAILGPNGAGKSTLLSLICGDNPQSYSNNIWLFGKKRGTGESIWDIKKDIGYVSPEMHHYYQKNVPARDIVGSGLFDTHGLYRKCNEAQMQKVSEWMLRFGIQELAEKSFLNVFSGEQRLCLLARAFVKDPSLLILDEPLHGLDISNKLKTKEIIEEFCRNPKKTLLYVTHYIAEIPNCIHKTFLLEKC